VPIIYIDKNGIPLKGFDMFMILLVSSAITIGFVGSMLWEKGNAN